MVISLETSRFCYRIFCIRLNPNAIDYYNVFFTSVLWIYSFDSLIVFSSDIYTFASRLSSCLFLSLVRDLPFRMRQCISTPVWPSSHHQPVSDSFIIYRFSRSKHLSHITGSIMHIFPILFALIAFRRFLLSLFHHLHTHTQNDLVFSSLFIS